MQRWRVERLLTLFQTTSPLARNPYTPSCSHVAPSLVDSEHPCFRWKRSESPNRRSETNARLDLGRNHDSSQLPSLPALWSEARISPRDARRQLSKVRHNNPRRSLRRVSTYISCVASSQAVLDRWLGELWRQKGAVNNIRPPQAHILVDGLLPEDSRKIDTQYAGDFYQGCLRNIFPGKLTDRRIFLVTGRMDSQHIDGLAKLLKLIYAAHNPGQSADRNLPVVQIQARCPGVPSDPMSPDLRTRYSVNDLNSGSWPSYARRSMLRKLGKLRPRVMTGEVAAGQINQARNAVQAQRQQAAASGSRGPVVAIGGREGGRGREYV